MDRTKPVIMLAALIFITSLNPSCSIRGEMVHHVLSCKLGKCIKACMSKEKDVEEHKDVCYRLYLTGVFVSSEEEIKDKITPEVKLLSCLALSNNCFK